jgi:hypothetical protein
MSRINCSPVSMRLEIITSSFLNKIFEDSFQLFIPEIDTFDSDCHYLIGDM